MDLSAFFEKIDYEDWEQAKQENPQGMACVSECYINEFPIWEDADIVLVGCGEDAAGLEQEGCNQAPNVIRQAFYRLAAPWKGIKIADLGNITEANDMETLYEKIAIITETILKQHKILILLGGTHDLLYGLFKGYESLEHPIEYVSIDSRLDMLNAEFGITNHSFNNQLFIHQPNYLKHFCNLGTQNYYVTENERVALRDLNFESIRVGDLHDNIHLAEPSLRNANLVGFDLSAVRHADAPGAIHPSPAGLTADQLCRLARFAGMGYHFNCAGIFELNPTLDIHSQTAQLSALTIWYLIEGYYNRKYDQPIADRSNVRQLSVQMQGAIKNIQFYYSEITDRWWMEVPDSQMLENNTGRSVLVPCTLRDYEIATLDSEIPERWWIAHYKLV